MADPRGPVLTLIILAFIFFSPDPAPPGQAGQLDRLSRINDVVAQERTSLSALQNSSWGALDLWNDSEEQSLNLTGLEWDRDYAWAALPNVKARAGELLEYSLGPDGKAELAGKPPGGSAISLYSNATGHVSGQWTRSPIQNSVMIPQLNLSAYAPLNATPKPFKRNITGESGGVQIQFRERAMPDSEGLARHQSLNMTKMMIDLAITDKQSSLEHEVELFGYYFVHLGQAILTTTSEKFAGIFMSPHFSLSEYTFESAKSLMNESLSKTIRRQDDHKIDAINPWSTDAEGSGGSLFAEPECELIVYLQQLPPRGLVSTSPTLLSSIEDELRFPTGASVPQAPELRFSMLAFSPDCGYVVESKGPPDHVLQDGDHLTGPKIEVLQAYMRHHLLAFSTTMLGKLVLLLRQMREANTPSTRSRLSLYTVLVLVLGDGFTTMTLLLLSFVIPALFTNLMAAAFLGCISAMVFGMRFLLDIWTVQAPERARHERAEAQAEQQRREEHAANVERIRNRSLAATRSATPNVAQEELPPPPAGRNNAESLPLPVTAGGPPVDTGATPIFFMPSDQQGPEPAGQPTLTTSTSTTTFGSFYTRFCLVLLACLLLSLNAASWSSTPRRIYFTTTSFLYLSFWCPQIYRNVQRNCRKALNWEFVAGQSLLRLVPFAYFYAYPHNVLFSKQDFFSLALLSIWLWIQVLLLASQEIIGPRWFVKDGWAPPAYDYHPILREDEEGASLPLGTSTLSSSSPDLARRDSITKDPNQKAGKRTFDCAICMQDLEVPILEAGAEDGAANLMLARRAYMVTPCRHIFHSPCLEGWMRYRLQCPNCREDLPPL